jgi:hypothetical protein
MSRTRFEARLRLTLESPFASHGLTAAAWGVDVAQARDADGRVILPGDMIRGNLRQAFLDLGLDVRSLFGVEDGDDRGRLIIGDLVAETPESPAILTRIEIDDDTGSVESGALVTVELSHPIGQEVEFTGPLVVFADDKAVLADIERALRLIPAVGAFKSVGFGIVVKAGVTPISARSMALPTQIAAWDDRVSLTMTFDRPLLVDADRIADNVFRGRAVIPGAVLKGALAARLSHAGRHGLEQALSTMVIGHAFPLHQQTEELSHLPLPLSLVTDEADATIADLLRALPRGETRAVLVGGTAPKFRVDWKDEAKARGLLGLRPDRGFTFDTRTRTAVDSGTGASAEGQLFSYSAVVPGNCRWRAVVDRNGADPEAFRILLATLAEGLDGIGKTDARAEISIGPAPMAPVATADGTWAITLTTPAVLNDPAALRQDADLWADYSAYWSKVVPGATLLSFFASQRLAGGWQAMRARRTDYYPWLLTEAGSVFLLRGGDGARIGSLLRTGLPLPSWLAEATWRTCSFVPENGFGAFRLDAVDHARLAREVAHV